MALNRRINGTPGAALVATLEQPQEPGQPRLYWSTAKTSWVADPTATIAVSPDPDKPNGGYLVQVPTATTSSWPDKVYLLTVQDPGSSSRDEITIQEYVTMIAGDDGGLGIPSVTLAVPTVAVNGVNVPAFTINGAAVTGGSLTLYNARYNAPQATTT